MEILINGLTINYTRENESNLGEILGALESECERSGMTITGIRVDDRALEASELDALFAQDPDDVSKIELETISGQDIRGMLRELGGEFSLCVVPLTDVPIQLQTGKELAVMETINRFSVSLERLYRLLPLLPLGGFDDEALNVGDTRLSELPGFLSPILEELLDALKKKDTILVGDLSEYELAPKIEELSAVLSAL